MCVYFVNYLLRIGRTSPSVATCYAHVKKNISVGVYSQTLMLNASLSYQSWAFL
jgi:hypothetical protein